MKILGFIPARGGSKTVPHKNIRLLAGKPLIAYTIEEAKKSKYTNRLIVSTDSAEIANVARDYGAEVPFMRPTELAQDDTQDLPVFQHALKWLNEHEDYTPDIVVHLRPTAPLRKAEHIDDAVDLLLNNSGDVVRSVSPVKNHPHKMWRIHEGRLFPFQLSGLWEREGPDVPRQKLEQVYQSNGVVDVFRSVILRQSVQYKDIKYIPYIIDDKYSVDLDTTEDFLYAEFLIQKMKEF